MSDDTPLKVFTKLLDNETLYPVFQPVVSLRQSKIIGYQSFVRGPADSVYHSPALLFRTAEHLGCIPRLDAKCGKVALRQFGRLNNPGLLFFQVHLAHLRDHLEPEKVLKWVHKFSLAPERIVVEIGVHPFGEDLQTLAKWMVAFREKRFRVAIHPFESIDQNRDILLKLPADYWKIDKYLVQDLQSDPFRKQLVRSLLQTGTERDCTLIAEGVETREEYETLLELGLELAQGYYFGRPHATPSITLPKDIFLAQSHTKMAGRSADTVLQLATAVAYVDPGEKTENVSRLFQRSPSLQSVPVVQNRQPAGLVHRQKLTDIFLMQFGRDLHGKKPIAQFMDPQPLIIPDDTSIEAASRQITTHMAGTLQAQEFIITRDGDYFGMGKILDLLKIITELQIRNASYANPLSGLPGNVPIEEEVTRLLASGEGFVACYCDLDNFKPFNDYYGFDLGDEVIKTVARILTGHIDPRVDFVGHVGGDDFIVLFRALDWEERCQRMLHDFAAEVPRFYNQTDLDQGGILGHDRQGEEVFFGLLSLSIGVALSDNCKSHHCVASQASEAKKQAKKNQGNAMFIERRKPLQEN